MAQIAISVAAIAAAALLLILMPLLSGGAATGDPSPAPISIGMPGCMTSCGGVDVPYPFRIGQDASCYLPGFNLTCNNTTGARPRLLLGTFQVPSTSSASIQYIYFAQRSGHSHRKFGINADGNARLDEPYTLDSGNELILTDSNVQAAMMNDNVTLTSCTSLCDESGTIIIIGVTIGAALLLLVLVAYFTSYKLKHWRTRSLKRKYLKKNRGQLLQQLVPQRADIAEKMIITLEDLEKATNNFDKVNELGRGGHAIVYKGILSDLHVVAIKKPTMVVQREIDEFINEVAILSQINHKNIVKLYGCCLETEVPLLVYEFISNGTLYGHLHVEGPRSLPWDARLRIATEIAKSLAYLHSIAIIPIIHRDVKPANILLDDTLTAKIADFGASMYVPLDKSGLTTMVQGTIGYLDPMYLSTCCLTVKSDVYSFGVMLIELMTRKKPFSYIDFEGNGLVSQFSTLFAEGNLSQVLDPQVMDEGDNKIEEIAGIAVSCVKLRGEERPTMRQVEMWLEATQPPEEFATISPSTRDGGSREGLTSRQYSMEEEYMLSARYPR